MTSIQSIELLDSDAAYQLKNLHAQIYAYKGLAETTLL